ncbi:MAG TPA: glycosyltransferase family 39 protein [bacterium]|nr:glycosyltransferase family 39 protein [bacterium]
MSDRTTPHRLWALLGLTIVLVAAAVTYLYVASLHEAQTDEAVFGRAALEILHGDFFLHDWRVMKPYMVYYTQALFRFVFGRSAFAGRLPGLLATLLCLWLIWRLGRRWLDEWTALVAVAFLALSPYVIYNYPTGRADALAMMFVLAALDRATMRRHGWAGFFYALAFCTRQLVALSFPLVIGTVFLVGHLDRDAATPWWRAAWRDLWRFAKGTIAPLLVLAAWSAYTKIPYAWLVNEFQSKKYADGAHLSVAYGEKLTYWLHHSLAFFGFAPPAMIALALVPLVAVWGVTTRALGRWTAREKPRYAFLTILAVFVLCFYLLNAGRFFTTYLRFLVPVAPWVTLLFAALLVGAVRKLMTRGPAWRKAAPVVVTAVCAVAIVAGAARYVPTLNHRMPEDDIPPVVRRLHQLHPHGAVLWTSDYGPEGSFATFRTPIVSLQFDRSPERFARLLPEHLDRDQYLYLDAKDAAKWRATLPALLAPHFTLQPTEENLTHAGTLYRVATQRTGGVADGTITYLADGEIVQAELTGDVLAQLLAEALTRMRKDDAPPVEIVFTECAPGANISALRWTATNLEYRRLRLARAEFAFRRVEVDWRTLAIARRLVMREADGWATFAVAPDDLAAFIARKNKNLRDVRVSVDGERLIIEATAATKLWQPRLRVVGTLDRENQRLLFHLTEVELDGHRAPGFVLRYAESVMNPILKVDLAMWGLELRKVEMQNGAIVLIAHGVL